MGSQNQKITLGQLNLSFYAVQAALVKEVLVQKGHEIELRQGAHQDVYPELGAGKIDVFVATWIPYSHSVFWETYKDVITPLGTGFEGGESFWAVPDYIPEDQVSSVEDLKKPEVKSKIRQLVRGIGAATGVTQRSQDVITEYDLAAHGYHVEPGTDAEWITSISEAYDAGEWFVCPLWQPQFLNKKYNLRKIAEPALCMGGIDTGRITAHSDFVARAPADTIETIKRISIGVDAITEMDYFVNVDGMSADEAARHWLAQNPDKLNHWLNGS